MQLLTPAVGLLCLGACALGAANKNIIFILTDDQDLQLHSLDHMDAVQTQLINEGLTFDKHYAHVSLCCPSRATLWTGRHAHNTNITDVGNANPGGGWNAVQENKLTDNYLPQWLLDAGYNTYYAGKLYNGHSEGNYCDPKCAGGLTEADFLLEPTTYTYYDSVFQHNRDNGHQQPKKAPGYSTDHITNHTLRYIDDAVESNKPFFAVAAPIAPHVSMHVQSDDGKKIPYPIPKHEYAQLYGNLGAYKSPNFNPSNHTGVNHIWDLDHLTQENEDFLDEYYRHRQRALKSVDDMVDAIVQRLTQHGILDETYIIYSSDNGYHLGNHRLQGGKKQCFEEDISVPFIIRGPGIAKGLSTDMVTGHVDVAPTIMNMAGVEAKAAWELDGQGLNFPLSDAAEVQAEASKRGEHINLEYWGTFGQEGKYNCMSFKQPRRPKRARCMY